MPSLIPAATRVTAAGVPPKTIDEFTGLANTGDARLSIAHMRSPSGWSEPGQRPAFDEFTLVLRGTLRVDHEQGTLEVSPGQAVHCRSGEWVRCSTRAPRGPSTSPSACRPSPPPPSTGTLSSYSCMLRAIWVTTLRGPKRVPKASTLLRRPGITRVRPACMAA